MPSDIIQMYDGSTPVYPRTKPEAVYRSDENDTALVKSDVINDLTSDSTIFPLSASQGKVLNNKIGQLQQKVQYPLMSNRRTLIFHYLSLNNNVTDNSFTLPNVTSKFGFYIKLNTDSTSLVLRIIERNSSSSIIVRNDFVNLGNGIWALNWTKQSVDTASAYLQITNQTGAKIIVETAWYVENVDVLLDDVVAYVGGIDKMGSLDGLMKLSTSYTPLTNNVLYPNPTDTGKKINEQDFTVESNKLLILNIANNIEQNASYNFLIQLDVDTDDVLDKMFISLSNDKKVYPYRFGSGYYGIFNVVNGSNFRINNTTSGSIVLKKLYCTKGFVPFFIDGGIVPELINDGAVKKEKLDIYAIGYTLALGTYNLIYSGQVSSNNTVISVVGKTLSDTVELESQCSVWYDFTDWVVGQKYNLIVYCENSTPFVKDNNLTVTTNFVNCGNGIFILLDYVPITTNVRVIITANIGGGVHRKTLIAKNAIPLNVPAKETIYSGTAGYKDILEVDTDYNDIPTVVPRNRFKYPLYPVWGHEYLYSWYVKIDPGTADIYMEFAGDSTTEAKGRHTSARKIMRLGGYPDNLIHSYDRGHGSMQTLEWIGEYLPSGVPVGGYLEQDMNMNVTYDNPNLPSHPDLYVIAYGYNDGSPYNWPDLTVEERVQGFERRLREGLGRIRTNNTFASGPSYNLSPEDMAVIICTPNQVAENNPQYATGYLNRIRDVIMKACRDFHCAFVDVGARQYDHTFSGSWSIHDDHLHPTQICVRDFMSMFADLIFPICFHIEG